MEVKEKKYQDAILRGAELMIENGLGDWKIKLQKKRTVLADCNYATRTIRYSEHFITVATKEQFEGVTLHEIAHALVGRGHGHDAAWKKQCVAISPDAVYAKSKADVPIPKYKLTCPSCKYEGGANRITRKRYCGRCFNRKREMVEFNVAPNILQVFAW